MGKKRVAYDFNDDDKPSNNVVTDHHHHHHRHHKPKKIKPEAKLLHTLNSHLKKLAKSRSRNVVSLSSPPRPAKDSRENKKDNHGINHLSNSWLKQDHKDDCYDWFMGFDCDVEDGGMGVFEFSQELCWDTKSVIGSEDNNYEDLFGGNCVFSPDLIVRHNNMMLVFEDDGSGYGSYIPDPVMNTDNGDEGKLLCDMLELSSLEDMINEFLKRQWKPSDQDGSDKKNTDMDFMYFRFQTKKKPSDQDEVEIG